jgi:hypothetical protein
MTRSRHLLGIWIWIICVCFGFRVANFGFPRLAADDGWLSGQVAVAVNRPAEIDDMPQNGEVQPGVLPEQLRSSPVVRPGRVDLVVEFAQPDGLALEADGRLPLPAFRIPRDPLEPRCPAGASPVPQILGLRALTQIVPSVVPFVAVDVVHDLAGSGVHDEAVHEDCLAPDPGTDVARASAHGTPTVPVEPLVVRRIDHRGAAMSQADEADAVVGRFRRLRIRPCPLTLEAPAVPRAVAAIYMRQHAFMLGAIDADQLPRRPVPDHQGAPAFPAPAVAGPRRTQPLVSVLCHLRLSIPDRRSQV